MRDSIAVIALNNPPVNSLGYVLHAGIVQGLDKAARDPTVKALVLIGAARTFSGGADIREFNTPKSSARPTLSEINDAQDRFPKPMIGAIGGFALGVDWSSRSAATTVSRPPTLSSHCPR